MDDSRDVTPIGLLTGMTVLSLASGNKLGKIVDLFIDPINGVLLGLTLSLPGGELAGIPQGEIYSFGRDAVMAKTELSVIPPDTDLLREGQPASKLIGTKIVTESGNVLGHITNIFVTLKSPPDIIYEARQSIIDKLLGRELFIPASVGHALSDDCACLVVPDITADIAASDPADIVGRRINVRSFDPESRRASDNDDTIAIPIDEDETFVRMDNEEEETVVRLGDDDDTVLRPPRRANS
jgi:uncharacterized protein YrrD